jgi:hypothetical protein
MEKSQERTERTAYDRTQQQAKTVNIREETERAVSLLRAGRALSGRHLDLILRSPKGMVTLAQMGMFSTE